MALYLIRYGELGLKSPGVRRLFERALRRNIMSRFVEAGMECRMEHERGRIFLWSDDADFATAVLSRTFGIVSFSNARETDSSRESIFELAVEIAAPLFKDGMSFAVRARRKGQHPYSSMELARDAGSAIYLANQEKEPVVNLTSPDLEVFVEVRQNRAFVYTEKLPGPGGMPLGTQGRVLGIVEDSQDIAACWPIMKRGCRVIVAASDIRFADPLKPWDPDLKVVELQDDLRELADAQRTQGIAVGWDIDGYDRRSGETVGLPIPVFYPLIGMAGADIDKLMARIVADPI